MDIHPPAGPVNSFGDYCVHLSMVVVGILIALGLESVLETHHSHQLADHAVRGMIAEIRSNRAQIETSIVSLERAKKELDQLLAEQKNAIDVLQRRSPPLPEVPIQPSAIAFPSLSSAAWDSALAMQAVGRIDVGTAEILSRIYTNQLEVKDLQRIFLDLALHIETYMGRPTNDTAERMIDRFGALQQLSTALQNLISGYRDMLRLYATSDTAAAEK